MTMPPWTRPTIDESAGDIELIPFGRTHEQEAKLLRIKAQGRSGLKGCLLYCVAFALVCAWAAGWAAGRFP